MPSYQVTEAPVGKWRADRIPGDDWLLVTFADATDQMITLAFGREGLRALTETVVAHSLAWDEEDREVKR